MEGLRVAAVQLQPGRRSPGSQWPVCSGWTINRKINAVSRRAFGRSPYSWIVASTPATSAWGSAAKCFRPPLPFGSESASPSAGFGFASA